MMIAIMIGADEGDDAFGGVCDGDGDVDDFEGNVDDDDGDVGDDDGGVGDDDGDDIFLVEGQSCKRTAAWLQWQKAKKEKQMAQSMHCMALTQKISFCQFH